MIAAASSGQPGSEESSEDSAAAYMAMLRRVHELSGFTAGQISAYSGLPRSTAYRFIDPKNNTLPKNRGQVEAFLNACRLAPQAVVRMLNLWDEVSGNPPQQPPHPDLGNDPDHRYRVHAQRLVVSSESSSEGEHSWLTWQEDPEQWRQDNTPQFPCVAPSPFPHHNDHDPPERAHPISEHCHSCSTLGRCHGEIAPQRRVATVVQTITTRAFPLVMLTIALYPMAAAVWFGHRFTGEFAGVLALIFVMCLLFSTASWVHKPSWSQLLTPIRLTTATVAGVGTGALAWFAVSIPLVGALTGVVVFTAAPAWINLTRLTGIATSTRGVFTLITATWCGIILGYAASLADFPALGAVLVGVMGAAMAVMLLSNNIFDEAESRTRQPTA
ncbi:hypothetical protein ACQPZ2_44220 (plasmid) [Nocardia pseudovaccinii]|uniref:hypothetical protein n=1 Tax=Nocardia pseudovaccinii TaxID=189540 RepID=UPI003D946C29